MDEKQNSALEPNSVDDFGLDEILAQISQTDIVTESQADESADSDQEASPIMEELLQPLEQEPLPEDDLDTQATMPLPEEIESTTESDSLPADLPDNKKPKGKKGRKKKSKKKKSRAQRALSTFLWLFCIVSISFLLAFGGLFVVSDYSGLAKDIFNGGDTSTKQIIIKEGASASDVALQLEEENILLSRHVFLLYLKLTDQGNNINYGAHDFSGDMSYGEILESLAEPVKKPDTQVMIPMCSTLTEIGDILEKAGVCSKAAFIREVIHGEFDSALWKAIPKDQKISYAMEGYLFPDTYNFYENDDPHRVVQKMLDNLEEHFTPQMQKDAKAMGYTTHEILTMASVIQMEADGFYEDMPKIAQVFYNRLNHWPEGQQKLQSDPTSNYVVDGIKNPDYDTYKIEGLPPGPMSTIGAEAIRAAVYPDQSVSAYFFVSDKFGKFYYNETYEAHEDTILELRRQGLWAAQ